MPLIIKRRANAADAAGAVPVARLDAGELVIGRAPECNLILENPMVSRRHCTIGGNGVIWQLTDTSASGTLLNGRRVVGTPTLRDGDIITVADAELVVELAHQPVGRTATPPEPGRARNLDLDNWSRSADHGAGPLPAAPAAMSIGNSGGQPSDALALLLQSAGISRQAIALDSGTLATMLGLILRTMTAGIGQLAHDRRQARRDLKLPDVPADGNPLLAGGDPAETMLARLLALPPAQAVDCVTAATREIDAHQRATLGAMQGAFGHALDQFAPAAIKQRALSDAAAWKAYEVAFAANDGFVDVFAQELSRSYTHFFNVDIS